VSAAEETTVAHPVEQSALPAQELAPQESQPEPEAVPAMAEAATGYASDFAHPQGGEEQAEEYKPDSETIKSTAAAWASWRQIRDTRKDGEVAQARPQEFELHEPVPAETAAAVAAGAEQTLQEASVPAKGDSPDVASIVESVLANLRPKLMEEISRKMAEKK
jgi:hypothetical protein